MTSNTPSNPPSSRPMTLRQQLNAIFMKEWPELEEQNGFSNTKRAIEALCQEIAREARSGRISEARPQPTALNNQVATPDSGAYHDGYRDGYQTAKHEFESQSIRKLENEKYQ